MVAAAAVFRSRSIALLAAYFTSSSFVVRELWALTGVISRFSRSLLVVAEIVYRISIVYCASLPFNGQISFAIKKNIHTLSESL